MAQIGDVSNITQTPRTDMNLETEREGLEGSQGLGQDTFFKLLITQLQNQDPLKPMENTAFVSQMAEFSALEKNEKIYSLLEEKLNPNKLVNNANLIGREIEAKIEGIDKKGIVNSVKTADNKVYAVIDDGSEINIDNIISVNEIQKEG